MKKLTTLLTVLTICANTTFAAPIIAQLNDDVGTGITNPRGEWEFLSAGNPQDWGTNIVTDATTYATIPYRDWNAGDDREMWFPTSGNAFSTPAVRIYDYSDDVNRRVYMYTNATTDSIIAWTSPYTGEIGIDGSVQDKDGNGGTGALRISVLSAGDTTDDNVLAGVTITDNAATADTFDLTTTVQAGDIIFFRKTFYKWDDYGTNTSSFDVTISIPEPTTALLFLPALLLFGRKQRP